MRIIVTGGLGFIGSNFITWMLENTSDATILNIDRGDYCSNSNNVKPDPRYKYVKGDVIDTCHMKTIFEVFQPEVVVHFAAQSHVDNSFECPLQFTKDNILGTHALIHVANEYGKLSKFIHISTDEVYGEVSDNEISSEKSLLNPTNPYAASKAGAEFIVKSYGHSFKFPWIITRGNNVFGPKQYPEKLVPSFINKILKGAPCTIHGVGNNTRNFVYVDDVSRAIYCILQKGEVYKTYNIGTNNEYNTMQIFEKLKSFMDPNASYELVKDRPFNDMRYCIDSTELQKLGWSESVAFDEGLKKTIQWYGENSNWWSA